MVDIGGGSTELIVGTGDEIAFHASLQAGVVRHTERHIASDPPTALELEALAADVARPDRERGRRRARRRGRARASPSPARRPRWPRSSWGSSPTTPSGSTATCSPCRRSSACSRSSPRCRSPSGREIPGLHPDRAPTIVAGVVILVEAMRAFGLERDRGLRARHPLRRRDRRRGAAANPLSTRTNLDQWTAGAAAGQMGQSSALNPQNLVAIRYLFMSSSVMPH